MEDKRGLLAEAVRRAADTVGRSLFPHFCVVCGSEGEVACAACLPDMNAQMRGVFSCPACGADSMFGRACPTCRFNFALEGVIAAAPYARMSPRELLHLYKYESVIEAGEAIRSLFAAFIASHRPLLGEVCRGAAVLPVPLHPIRLALRGFNQSAILADVLRREFGASDADGILGRRFRFKRQVQAAAQDERRRNAEGSVVLRRRFPAGTKFVLTDDVFTTGATLNECARVLKSAGAGEVWGVTFLRG
jgi:ComF family protein